jgi:uroporphyrinogen decarboxylase
MRECEDDPDMTGRERVLAALDHREPDVVPIDLGGTNVTGIHRVALEGLAGALGFEADVSMLDIRLGLASLDRRMRELLGVDAGLVTQSGPSPDRWRLEVESVGDHAELRDEY